MAEAFAAIGFASALVTFIDFGSRVVRHIRQLEQDGVDNPKVFQSIRTRLPLMLDLVQKIMIQVDAGTVNNTTQEHMLPVIRTCAQQAEQLDKLIRKALPNGRESSWGRGKKAILSVLAETDIQKIDTVLKANFDLLLQAGTFQSVSRLDRSKSADVSPPFGMYPTVNVSVLHQDANSRLPSYDSFRAYEELKTSYDELQKTGSHSAQSIYMVPFQRDPNFLGRQLIIDAVDRNFQTQQYVSLAGLGGIGKSQIAIEYCYLFRERHPEAHVFWIYAGNHVRFEQGYRDIARRLVLPGWDDQKTDKCDLVYHWLNDEHDQDWLLVVDNADDAEMFHMSRSGSRDTDEERKSIEKAKSYARYLPHGPCGSVLVTTRDKRVGERLSGRHKPIEVLPLSATESLELLHSKIPEEDWSESDGMRLVKELSYLPLAITQAAAFISENSITVSEYLDTLYCGDADLKELMSEHLEDPRRDLDTENSVMRTWKLSFDQISKGLPRAAEILSLLAVLDYHGAPRTLLRKEDETETGFRTALGTLQAFSLLTAGRGKEAACKMHRLVALSTQKWLEVSGTLHYWQSEALKLLSKHFPESGWQTVEFWTSLDQLTPHTQVVFSFHFNSTIDLLRCATLLDASALYDLSRGKYEDAFKKSERSLKIRQDRLPEDDPATLQSTQTLGETLLHLGELHRARETLQKAIEGREKSLGPLHPDTLESLSDLTITLLELDLVDAAKATSQRAMEGREQVLGIDDRDTLVSKNIYAMLQHRQGNLASARDLYEATLHGRETLLGREHPDTLMTLNNLARLRYQQGDLEVAKQMLERVVAGEATTLGAEGYDIQVSLSNLALVYRGQADLDGAESTLRRVLAMRTKKLGPHHPSSLLTMEMIADVLQEKGDLNAAEIMYQRAAKVGGRQEGAEAAGALLRAGLLFD